MLCIRKVYLYSIVLKCDIYADELSLDCLCPNQHGELKNQSGNVTYQFSCVFMDCFWSIIPPKRVTESSNKHINYCNLDKITNTRVKDSIYIYESK